MLHRLEVDAGAVTVTAFIPGPGRPALRLARSACVGPASRRLARGTLRSRRPHAAVPELPTEDDPTHSLCGLLPLPVLFFRIRLPFFRLFVVFVRHSRADGPFESGGYARSVAAALRCQGHLSGLGLPARIVRGAVERPNGLGGVQRLHVGQHQARAHPGLVVQEEIYCVHGKEVDCRNKRRRHEDFSVVQHRGNRKDSYDVSATVDQSVHGSGDLRDAVLPVVRLRFRGRDLWRLEIPCRHGLRRYSASSPEGLGLPAVGGRSPIIFTRPAVPAE